MFHLSNGKISAYQWDLDLFLILEDYTINEVHFSNKTMSEALVVDAHMDDKNNCIAAIPNKLLQSPYDIQAYIWIDKYTKIDYIIPIQKRPKPANYVYTETEIKRWETLAERIEEQIDISTSLNKQTATLVQEAEEQIAKSEQLIKETEDFLENSAEIMKELQVAENHERRITQLEHHINDDYFITTDDKNIPTNACPYIQLETIGGKTTQKFKTAYIKNLKYTGEQSITVYGVNITIKEDKTIEVKGYYDETAEHEFFSPYMGDLPLGPCEFYLNCKGEPCNVSFFVDVMHYEDWGEDEKQLIDNSNECTVAEYLQRPKEDIEPFVSAPNHDAGVDFQIHFDQCINGEYINFTIKPMLVNTSICDGLVDNKITALKSTGANPYTSEPIDIIQISEELQPTGKGVKGIYDIVDLVNGKRITKTRTENLVNLSWSIQGTGNAENSYITTNGNVGIITYTCQDFDTTIADAIICNRLPVKTDWTPTTVGIHTQPMSSGNHYISMGIPMAELGVVIADSYSEIQKKIKQYLIDKPIIFTYALAKEHYITEDIDTSAIDNIMKVQAGGRIETINTQDEDLPISYTYLAKEGTI